MLMSDEERKNALLAELSRDMKAMCVRLDKLLAVVGPLMKELQKRDSSAAKVTEAAGRIEEAADEVVERIEELLEAGEEDDDDEDGD